MVLCGYNHQFNSINLYCCWEGMTMQLQLMDDCEEIEWKARQRNWSKEYFNSYAARKWQILTSNNSKVSWQCEVRGGHIKASVDTKLSCLHHQSKKMTNRGRKHVIIFIKSQRNKPVDTQTEGETSTTTITTSTKTSRCFMHITFGGDHHYWFQATTT